MTAQPSTPVAHQRQQLATVSAYADSVARINAALHTGATHQAAAIVAEFEATLRTMARDGTLTPEARLALLQLTRTALTSLDGLTVDVGQRLTSLVVTYGDPRQAPNAWERLKAWMTSETFWDDEL